MKHPLPEGTRVHHRAQEWTWGWTEAQCRANPQWGWGTILSVHSGPYSDGSYEYVVRSDAPLSEGGTAETHWASYHIDEAHSGVAREWDAAWERRRAEAAR